MTDFTGSTALVTGRGSGIGYAVASTLARDGANVVVTDLDEGAARRTTEAITQPGGHAVGPGFVQTP
jgi:NAD(P)-dependent dehydrogenase (short-subunit alcohol dehydrogenase family)